MAVDVTFCFLGNFIQWLLSIGILHTGLVSLLSHLDTFLEQKNMPFITALWAFFYCFTKFFTDNS